MNSTSFSFSSSFVDDRLVHEESAVNCVSVHYRKVIQRLSLSVSCCCHLTSPPLVHLTDGPDPVRSILLLLTMPQKRRANLPLLLRKGSSSFYTGAQTGAAHFLPLLFSAVFSQLLSFYPWIEGQKRRLLEEQTKPTVTDVLCFARGRERETEWPPKLDREYIQW